ncbi:MAG: hypothetical protein AMJ88_08215 [Anaerolineae bacterium SM23_ 63]|nr:MAG: hypothetical protein AMJ88_08215 [Anaerolineae bacterium SM23_ 63]HEY46721.1 DUF4175 domain-containing protein [Anaerolineae bacterium]
MTRRLWYVSLGCATCALVAGYAIGDLWIWTLPILGLAVLRLLGQPKWVTSLELLLFVGLAAIGLWQGLPFGLMLLGMIAALIAWDIESFHQRMEVAERVDYREALERKYLQRLLIIEGSGALLAVAAVSLTVTFSFGSALLLGLLAVIGLSRTIGFLRRESD